MPILHIAVNTNASRHAQKLQRICDQLRDTHEELTSLAAMLPAMTDGTAQSQPYLTGQLGLDPAIGIGAKTTIDDALAALNTNAALLVLRTRVG